MTPDEQLQTAKMKAIAAAKECADRMKISIDQVRVLFEEFWEVVEREWPRQRRRALRLSELSCRQQTLRLMPSDRFKIERG
jgi:hypothetical protein